MTTLTTAGRAFEWLLVALARAVVAVYAVGWAATAVFFWQHTPLYVPRMQSAIVIALALVLLRASAAPRKSRRLMVLCALVVAAVSFVAVPLPQQFEGHNLMPGGADAAASRKEFEDRFRVGNGIVNFHSHLGDVVMARLDMAFGRSDSSPARAYDAISRLAGLLFLIELAIVAAWHRWSRQSCRYVALALASPLPLLFFGYWEIGYLAIGVGVVPLLAVAMRRRNIEGDAATLTAGFLQGFHTAFHGFGLFGLAGGALAALSIRGTFVQRLVRTATFTSAALALYLGWILLYVMFGLSVVWARQIGYRPMFEAMVFDHRLANPLFSLPGLGEFGLFSALSGVPLLGLSLFTTRRAALVPAILFGLPGLYFLFRWWPVSAPYNLDLILSVFPGVFAACWVLASSRVRSMAAFVILFVLHVVLWTTMASGVFQRVWVETP